MVKHPVDSTLSHSPFLRYHISPMRMPPIFNTFRLPTSLLILMLGMFAADGYGQKAGENVDQKDGQAADKKDSEAAEEIDGPKRIKLAEKPDTDPTKKPSAEELQAAFNQLGAERFAEREAAAAPSKSDATCVAVISPDSRPKTSN